MQICEDRLRVHPHELVGAARDAIWRDKILAEAPEVARYARKAGRTIPVVILRPFDSSRTR